MNRAPNPCNLSLSQSLCPHLEILANAHYLMTKVVSDRDPPCAEDVTRFMEWSDQALNAMVRLIWEDLENSEADVKDPERALGFKMRTCPICQRVMTEERKQSQVPSLPQRPAEGAPITDVSRIRYECSHCHHIEEGFPLPAQ
jgi:hypothetical protein